jgi:hypothetical protein
LLQVGRFLGQCFFWREKYSPQGRHVWTSCCAPKNPSATAVLITAVVLSRTPHSQRPESPRFLASSSQSLLHSIHILTTWLAVGAKNNWRGVWDCFSVKLPQINFWDQLWVTSGVHISAMEMPLRHLNFMCHRFCPQCIYYTIYFEFVTSCETVNVLAIFGYPPNGSTSKILNRRWKMPPQGQRCGKMHSTRCKMPCKDKDIQRLLSKT